MSAEDNYEHIIEKVATLLKLRAPWVDFDELRGYAGFGVAKALAQYDPNRGELVAHLVKKGQYAAIDQMRHERVMFRSSQTHLPREFPASNVDPEAFSGGSGGADTPVAFVTARYSADLDLDVKDAAQYTLNLLPKERDRDVVMSRMRGETRSSIADRYGVTPSAVDVWYHKALSRIRRKVPKEAYG